MSHASPNETVILRPVVGPKDLPEMFIACMPHTGFSTGTPGQKAN